MSDTLFEPEWESVRADDLVISLHRGRILDVDGIEFAFTGTHPENREDGQYVVIHGRDHDGKSVAAMLRPGETLRVKAKGSGS